MNIQSIHKKQILKDPITLLDRLTPGLTVDTSTLSNLHTSYQSVYQQQTILNDELKTSSRKIGEAKKQNRPVDDLKAQTRALSHQLKPLTEQLKKLEQEIQDEFTRLADHVTQPTKEKGALKKETQNRYQLTGATLQDVTINVIDTNSIADKNADVLQRWNRYVLKHPSGTIHHQIDWQTIMHRAYGHQSYYFYACTASGSIIGVLPVVRLSSKLFGNLMVSMPYFQRGGAIADNVEIEKLLINAANNKARMLAVETIEYRDDIYRKNMPVQQHKVNMILSLPDSSETLWKSFSAKLRAQIKRSQREKPQKQIGRLELLNDFYKVYTRNMRDLGSPPHSKYFIKTILQTFPDKSWLVVIRHNNQVVAAALLLASKETMEIPLASTIRAANPLSMNMFLYWEILQFAILKGYKKFDFGRSSVDAGTYRFKRQWGAEPKKLYWNYWLADGTEVPRLNPDNPKYAIAIRCWKKIPLFMTQWLGPHIVKNLP